MDAMTALPQLNYIMRVYEREITELKEQNDVLREALADETRCGRECRTLLKLLRDRDLGECAADHPDWIERIDALTAEVGR